MTVVNSNRCLLVKCSELCGRTRDEVSFVIKYAMLISTQLPKISVSRPFKGTIVRIYVDVLLCLFQRLQTCSTLLIQ